MALRDTDLCAGRLRCAMLEERQLPAHKAGYLSELKALYGQIHINAIRCGIVSRTGCPTAGFGLVPSSAHLP